MDLAVERMERAKVYFEAVEPYPLVDIEDAARNFISGSAPGVNPNFVPPAPVVAAECRRVMNLRLDREARDKRLHPKLPPPDVERTPESQQRVRDLVAQTVANLAPAGDEDPAERHRKRLQKTNAYFDAERYTVGDPDGERDVA